MNGPDHMDGDSDSSASDPRPADRSELQASGANIGAIGNHNTQINNFQNSQIEAQTAFVSEKPRTRSWRFRCPECALEQRAFMATISPKGEMLYIRNETALIYAPDLPDGETLDFKMEEVIPLSHVRTVFAAEMVDRNAHLHLALCPRCQHFPSNTTGGCCVSESTGGGMPGRIRLPASAALFDSLHDAAVLAGLEMPSPAQFTRLPVDSLEGFFLVDRPILACTLIKKKQAKGR
ncbi:hypothetical protein [Nocardia sp. NBC_01388]|uniref:hypothetical protein n=1 Tax=Nocardia sp. NBC_01388 TaxID=2903596 RepID=UPI00324B5561